MSESSGEGESQYNQQGGGGGNVDRNWEWIACVYDMKRSTPESEITWNLSPSIMLTLPSEQNVQPKVDLVIESSKNFIFTEGLGWNWHKSWNIPDIHCTLDIRDPLTQEKLLPPSKIYAELYVVRAVINQIHTFHLVDVGIKGTNRSDFDSSRSVFTGLKFDTTSYNHEGSKFHLVIVVYLNQNKFEHPKILESRISPPIFVDSRKQARATQQQKAQKLSSFIDPFAPENLDKEFVKRESKKKSSVDEPINNNIEGLSNFFSAPNIRHKVKHPLFLAIKFFQCVKIYYNVNIIPVNNNNDKFVEVMQKQLMEAYNRSSSTSTMQIEEKPLILTIEHNLTPQNFKQKKINEFLEPLHGDVLHVMIEAATIPNNFRKLEDINGVKDAYKRLYPKISQQKFSQGQDDDDDDDSNEHQARPTKGSKANNKGASKVKQEKQPSNKQQFHSDGSDDEDDGGQQFQGMNPTKKLKQNESNQADLQQQQHIQQIIDQKKIQMKHPSQQSSEINLTATAQNNQQVANMILQGAKPNRPEKPIKSTGEEQQLAPSPQNPTNGKATKPKAATGKRASKNAAAAATTAATGSSSTVPASSSAAVVPPTSSENLQFQQQLNPSHLGMPNQQQQFSQQQQQGNMGMPLSLQNTMMMNQPQQQQQHPSQLQNQPYNQQTQQQQYQQHQQQGQQWGQQQQNQQHQQYPNQQQYPQQQQQQQFPRMPSGNPSQMIPPQFMTADQFKQQQPGQQQQQPAYSQNPYQQQYYQQQQQQQQQQFQQQHNQSQYNQPQQQQQFYQQGNQYGQQQQNQAFDQNNYDAMSKTYSQQNPQQQQQHSQYAQNPQQQNPQQYMNMQQQQQQQMAAQQRGMMNNPIYSQNQQQQQQLQGGSAVPPQYPGGAAAFKQPVAGGATAATSATAIPAGGAPSAAGLGGVAASATSASQVPANSGSVHLTNSQQTYLQSSGHGIDGTTTAPATNNGTTNVSDAQIPLNASAHSNVNPASSIAPGAVGQAAGASGVAASSGSASNLPYGQQQQQQQQQYLRNQQALGIAANGNGVNGASNLSSSQQAAQPQLTPQQLQLQQQQQRFQNQKGQQPLGGAPAGNFYDMNGNPIPQQQQQQQSQQPQSSHLIDPATQQPYSYGQQQYSMNALGNFGQPNLQQSQMPQQPNAVNYGTNEEDQDGFNYQQSQYSRYQSAQQYQQNGQFGFNPSTGATATAAAAGAVPAVGAAIAGGATSVNGVNQAQQNYPNAAAQYGYPQQSQPQNAATAAAAVAAQQYGYGSQQQQQYAMTAAFQGAAGNVGVDNSYMKGLYYQQGGQPGHPDLLVPNQLAYQNQIRAHSNSIPQNLYVPTSGKPEDEY